jgi:hypothetical protein
MLLVFIYYRGYHEITTLIELLVLINVCFYNVPYLTELWVLGESGGQ